MNGHFGPEWKKTETQAWSQTANLPLFLFIIKYATNEANITTKTPMTNAYIRSLSKVPGRSVGDAVKQKIPELILLGEV